MFCFNYKCVYCLITYNNYRIKNVNNFFKLLQKLHTKVKKCQLVSVALLAVIRIVIISLVVTARTYMEPHPGRMGGGGQFSKWVVLLYSSFIIQVVQEDKVPRRGALFSTEERHSSLLYIKG